MSTKISTILTFLTILAIFQLAHSEPNLDVIAEWKKLNYGFETAEQEQRVLQNGYYIPNNQHMPYDGDIYVDANGRWRKFLSIPRVQAGVPYTLAEVVDDTETAKGPLLRAYPNAEMHLNRSCDGIFSAFRMWVDTDCHRLWVIDNGRDFQPPATYGPKTQICPPKLVVFDLRTDTIELSYQIPTSQYTNEVSAFNGVYLLPSLTCSRTRGYVTDARGYGIVVFKRQDNNFKSWRINSEYFKPDPAHFKASIANESFTFTDGIYTVTPSIRNQLLYFHPYASLTEYTIPMPLANFEEIWQHNPNLDFFIDDIGKRPTQTTIQVLDSKENIWFALLDPTLGMYCWNTSKKYNETNFKLIIANKEVFQFVAGLKIRNLPGKGESIVGTSNRKQRHSAGTVSPDEINYRVFVFSIKDTDCNTN